MRALFIKYLLLFTFFWILINKSLSLGMTHLSKESGIYCIENTSTKEKYIGESSNPHRRKYEHLSRLRNGIHANINLQADYYKYGERFFTFYSLFSCIPEERKEKESFYIKELNATYNIELDSIKKEGLTYREKLSIAAKERWKKPGYKEQIIASSLKAVEQLNLETGEVIKEFPSAAEASRITNIYIDAIGQTCRGTTFTAGKFRWRFKGEEEKGSSTWEKKVIAKDKTTLEVVGEYNSIKEASEKTGCRRPAISDCLAGRNKSSKGLLWSYKDSNFKLDKHLIVMLDKETIQELNTFNTLKEACEFTGLKSEASISTAIKKNSFSGGYKWKYKVTNS